MNVSDLIGIPYRERGRTRDGMDCYGLVLEAARRMGKELPDVDYDSSHDVALADEHAPTLPLVRTDKPREGVILEMESGGKLHVGICIDSRRFIHATTGQGVRISPVGSIRIRRMYTWQ